MPYAQHLKSHVESDLMLLPNGCVYGLHRLLEHARKMGLGPESIKDLRTGEVFEREELKKLFIM